MHKIEQQHAIEMLAQSGKEFIPLFESGKLTVEIYKPQVEDKQLPHDRDEFYLVISGMGTFTLGEESTPFKPGDFLFVPAHAEHRFIHFTDDFVTWVFFLI